MVPYESFNYYNLLHLITTLKLYRCLDLRKVTLQVYGVEKELITASWRCWLGCSGARHKSLICHLIGDWLPAVQSISLSAFWKNNISSTLLINTFVQDLYQETARMISFPDNSQLDKILCWMWLPSTDNKLESFTGHWMLDISLLWTMFHIMRPEPGFCCCCRSFMTPPHELIHFICKSEGDKVKW